MHSLEGSASGRAPKGRHTKTKTGGWTASSTSPFTRSPACAARPAQFRAGAVWAPEAPQRTRGCCIGTRSATKDARMLCRQARRMPCGHLKAQARERGWSWGGEVRRREKDSVRRGHGWRGCGRRGDLRLDRLDLDLEMPERREIRLEHLAACEQQRRQHDERGNGGQHRLHEERHQVQERHLEARDRAAMSGRIEAVWRRSRIVLLRRTIVARTGSLRMSGMTA